MKELTLIPIASLFAETITHPVDFIKTQKQYLKTPVPFYTLFWSTLLSTPADVIKTRLMADSKHTMFQCAKDIIRNEGFLSLWKGFFPNWFRLAPWQFVFWTTYERLRVLNKLESF